MLAKKTQDKKSGSEDPKIIVVKQEAEKEETEPKIKSMLFYDVNNGIARRSWARNKEAMFAIQREMERTPKIYILKHQIILMTEDLISGVLLYSGSQEIALL